MRNRKTVRGEVDQEMLLTVDEVAEFLGVSPRTVLVLPLHQIRIGPRLVRYRKKDVYAYAGLDDPNEQ